MREARLNQIESMLAAVIQTLGTLKAYFEEEREENGARYRETQRRFEQVDKRFEQIDQRFERVDERFDEVMEELRENRKEHLYMGERIFQNEIEIRKLKDVGATA